MMPSNGDGAQGPQPSGRTSGPVPTLGPPGGAAVEAAGYGALTAGAAGADVGAPQQEPTEYAQPIRRVDWAVMPRVNLLPPEIMERRRFRRLQRVLGSVVLLVVVLCGLATIWAQAGVASAEAALAVTRAETAGLQNQQVQYAEVPKVFAELEMARAARETALASDVLWYRFLTDLAVNTPEGTALTSVAITVTGSTSTSATEPLVPDGLGTVTVRGEAGRFVDVAAWLDSVARVNGLGGVRLQTASREGPSSGSGTIAYSGRAVITPSALSHRFDRKAG